jgi:hypothetical protein
VGVPPIGELRADRLGGVTAAWSERIGNESRVVKVAHRAPGARFGPSLPVPAPPTARFVQWEPVDVGPTGDLLTAWAPDYYADAGTIQSGPFGVPPALAQPVPGHPRGVAAAGELGGDLVVLGHKTEAMYGSRLVSARRDAATGLFGGFRDVDAGCRDLGSWMYVDVGDDGTGAILSVDPTQALWLTVDAPSAAPPARACLPPAAYGIVPAKPEPPPVPELPVPPLPDPPVRIPPAPRPPVLDAVIESTRVDRAAGAEIVTLSVRCGACTARASGRLLAKRRVLSRAKSRWARAARGRARVRLRFTLPRRARAAASGPRRYAIDVRAAAPGAGEVLRRVTLAARGG